MKSTSLLLAGMFLVTFAVPLRAADAPRQPAVAELLEDNAEALLAKLGGGPGEGRVEKGIVFSGKESIRIIPMQRFERAIPGWKYRIVEKPGPGEYRYLRFAWRADGCRGIMVQLHDEKDWNIRYTAGIDVPGWGTKYVAEKPPEEWAVVTIDLFKDFGERTIQGIALTAFDGRAGYFDHIYFGRSVEDLDRIDATGLRGKKPEKLTPESLERLWSDLAGRDASRAYLALWTLVASSEQAVPFLRGKLQGSPATATQEQLRQWIGELDDPRFRVREKATQHLAEHIESAAGLLEKVLADKPSPEVRSRAERLLAGRRGVEDRKVRVVLGVRVLEYASSPDARKCLEDLAREEDITVRSSAKAALQRLNASGRK